MSKLSRRSFLLACSCTAVSLAIDAPALAQVSSGPPPAANNTALIWGSGGVVVIPPTVGGVTLTDGQRRTLGQMANDFFKSGMSRKQANITMSAVMRAFCTDMSERGFLGVLAAAAIGGTYNLATTGNPLHGVIDLSAGTPRIKLPRLACADTPYRGGSYPDTITMGWYRNDSTCSTSTATGFRIAVLNYNSASGSGNPGGDHQWAWGYTQNLGGGKYKHFYTTSFPANGGAVVLLVPYLTANQGSLDVSKMLPTDAPGQAISPELLHAIKYALWKKAKDSPNWGNYAGVFQEPTSTPGVWQGTSSPPPTAPPATYTAGTSTPWGDGPTVSDFVEKHPASTVDPGNVEYPAEAKFPGEAGYTGGGSGGDGGDGGDGGTGGNSSGPMEIDWGEVPEDKPDADLDPPVAPTPWVPTPFTVPSMPGQCSGIPLDWSGALGPGAKANINPCQVLDTAKPIVRPVAVAGWTVYAFSELLDL